MQLKSFTLNWLFAKQKSTDRDSKADNVCVRAEQLKGKKGQSSFKNLFKCFEDAEEPVIINPNAQNLIKPISTSAECNREDSRIRDWLLDSARYTSPPATPHGDPSQKDSAASEAALSKATTLSFPYPCPEDPGKEDALPVLAKLIGQAPQPAKPREQEHEVLFSRRGAPPPAEAAGSRARLEQPPARGETARSGAAATAATAPKTEEAPGGIGGWQRGWWPESLGSLVLSPVACTQSRRPPAPSSP